MWHKTGHPAWQPTCDETHTDVRLVFARKTTVSNWAWSEVLNTSFVEPSIDDSSRFAISKGRVSKVSPNSWAARLPSREKRHLHRFVHLIEPITHSPNLIRMETKPFAKPLHGVGVMQCRLWRFGRRKDRQHWFCDRKFKKQIHAFYLQITFRRKRYCIRRDAYPPNRFQRI